MGLIRIGLALLVASAIATQWTTELYNGRLHPVNFWSFFTIVSNAFGAVVLLFAAFRQPHDTHGRDVVRGAATLCLTIVGVVFSVLLASLESNVVPWVNAVVHFIMPVALIVDWAVDPPQTRVTPRDLPWWLAVPTIYVAYTLIRGAAVHWYPYPFLNADAIGYRAVAIAVLGIAAFTVAMAFALLTIGNALRARRNTKGITR